MSKQKHKQHGAADAMSWEEAMRLIDSLYQDGKYRESMLIAAGCFLGMRISDTLELKWGDVLGEELISRDEKKTGKSRSLKLNKNFRAHAQNCWEETGEPTLDTFIFNGLQNGGETHLTRQRIDQILKGIKTEYQIKSASTFSSHTLRKTFGRRVWNQECKKGKGEFALMLLQEVFNHSSVNITKRYLGIRQDEILSVYDSLS